MSVVFLFNGRDFNLAPTLNTPWLPVINKRASPCFQIETNSWTQRDCDVDGRPGVLLSSSIIKWSGAYGYSLLSFAVMDLRGSWSDFLWRFPSGLMCPAWLTVFLHELLTLSSSLFLPVAVWLFFLAVCEFVICLQQQQKEQCGSKMCCNSPYNQAVDRIPDAELRATVIAVTFLYSHPVSRCCFQSTASERRLDCWCIIFSFHFGLEWKRTHHLWYLMKTYPTAPGVPITFTI